MARVGVTRVSEVTGLDRVGIPNFMTVRPRDAEQGISYYNGKGTDRQSARAGAMMEAIERYSGERCDLPCAFGTYEEVRSAGAVVDPDQIIVPRVRELGDEPRLEWVAGFDLISRRPTLVPLNAVVCPYTPAPPARPLYYASTNGLASGNTIEDALCHALCEVVERDSLAIAFASIELCPAVNQILADCGREAAAEPHPYPLVGLHGLPARAARAVRKLVRAGLIVYLRDVTSTAEIPTIDCTVVEQQPDGRHIVHGGCGTHPDARVALLRAVTEAAQSRVACIQGGREDLPEIVRSPDPFDHEEIYGQGEVVSFSEIPTWNNESVTEDVRLLVRRLRRAGFEQVVAVDLSREEAAFPVVRVVVPKAEAWTVFHLHTNRGTFGDRVADVLSGADT